MLCGHQRWELQDHIAGALRPTSERAWMHQPCARAGYLLLCHAITMSRYASSLDRKEVKNSLLPPLHSISIELGKPQCRRLRTLVTSCRTLSTP